MRFYIPTSWYGVNWHGYPAGNTGVAAESMPKRLDLAAAWPTTAWEQSEHDAGRLAGRKPWSRSFQPPPISGSRRAPSRGTEEHTTQLQSLMRLSNAVFCLKKKKVTATNLDNDHH